MRLSIFIIFTLYPIHRTLQGVLPHDLMLSYSALKHSFQSYIHLHSHCHHPPTCTNRLHMLLTLRTTTFYSVCCRVHVVCTALTARLITQTGIITSLSESNCSPPTEGTGVLSGCSGKRHPRGGGACEVSILYLFKYSLSHSPRARNGHYHMP